MKLHNWILAAVIGCVAALQSSAGTIEIGLTGVDLTYTDIDGIGVGTGSLTDTGSGADALGVIAFVNNGSPVGALSAPGNTLSLDLSITGIPSIAVPLLPGNSTTVTAPAGGTLTLSANASPILSLNLAGVDVIYNPVTSQIRFLFAASVGSIASQNLPFGLSIVDPVTVAFNVTGTPTASGGFLTSFVGTGGGGTLTAAQAIPEPGTLAMMGLGSLMSLMIYSRYKLG